MGFKAGIVGLPNVGKSPLFIALTRTAAAQAANYPFCTIEPNVGDVAMPEPRLDVFNRGQRVLHRVVQQRGDDGVLIHFEVGHQPRNLDRMAETKQQALWQRGQFLLAKLDEGESL